MDQGAVQELFRRAIAESDATVMREGLEHFLGITDGRDLSADEEYELRSAEFIMEMPQTGERIRGRDAMRSMQEAFPNPPMSVKIRRVMGAHRFWVLEGEIDYGRGPWTATILLEFDQDGLIARETRYYAEKSEPPAWRSTWVEPIEEVAETYRT